VVGAGCEADFAPGQREHDLRAVRLVADGDDRLAAPARRVPHVVGGRPGREPLVRLRLEPRRFRDRARRLTGPEERARDHRLEPLGGQAEPQRARGVAAGRGERSQVVGVARRCLGVADEDETHAQNATRVETMRRLRYVVCDVFTDTPLEGNQLAVFTDARDLDELTMQALAREMNFSETVFVLPPQAAEADVRIRIFTPGAELPFAGHPTLGTAFVLGVPLQKVVIRIETRAGVVPVELEREAARIVFGWMQQPLPRWRPFERVEELLAALGVAGSGLPVEQYDLGPGFVFVELPSPEDVAALRPDFAALGEVMHYGASCFARDDGGWKTRVFFADLGVPEDPATGSAAGPLAVHLARHGRAAFGDEIVISQGVELGRPSMLYARAEGSGERLERVYVGGAAKIVARGEFTLP
jgi:trans-2,3-dihydro-3-hydroxyanthranilate isomerase